jgi:hypothetical protein
MIAATMAAQWMAPSTPISQRVSCRETAFADASNASPAVM